MGKPNANGRIHTRQDARVAQVEPGNDKLKEAMTRLTAGFEDSAF